MLRYIRMWRVFIAVGFGLLTQIRTIGQNMEEIPHQTKIDFGAYKIVVHDFLADQVIFTEEIDQFNSYDSHTATYTTLEEEDGTVAIRAESDSFFISEYVFEDISNKLLEFIPDEGGMKIRVSYAVQETLNEQYDPSKFDNKNFSSAEELEKAVEDWDLQKAHWSGLSEFKSLSDSSKFFFRIPFLWKRYNDVTLRKRMNLTETNIDLSQEDTNVATVIYQGKPCIYNLDKLYLRIESTDKQKKKEVRYVIVQLTYGC